MLFLVAFGNQSYILLQTEIGFPVLGIRRCLLNPLVKYLKYLGSSYSLGNENIKEDIGTVVGVDFVETVSLINISPNCLFLAESRQRLLYDDKYGIKCTLCATKRYFPLSTLNISSQIDIQLNPI